MAEKSIPAGVRERLGIGPGLTLVQLAYSPYCIPIRAALESSGAPHTILDIPLWDRRPVIELTDAAYYTVPVLVDVDGSREVVIYESRDDGTDVPRYVDAKFALGLFPQDLEGLQDLVVRYIENEVEDAAFRLHDAFAIPRMEDAVTRGMMLRHKERKFGRGCVDQWGAQAPALREKLVDLLAPLERMLGNGRFLFGARVTYADFALYGVLGCLTFTGDNEIPRETPNVRRWHAELKAVRLPARVPVTA
jgi:glutathione S-transferase